LRFILSSAEQITGIRKRARIITFLVVLTFI
jgi:hypothetical protein